MNKVVHTTVCLMQGVVRFELCAEVMRIGLRKSYALGLVRGLCCGSVPRLVRMGCGVRCPGFFCAGGGSEEVYKGCEVRSVIVWVEGLKRCARACGVMLCAVQRVMRSFGKMLVLEAMRVLRA